MDQREYKAKLHAIKVKLIQEITEKCLVFKDTGYVSDVIEKKEVIKILNKHL